MKRKKKKNLISNVLSINKLWLAEHSNIDEISSDIVKVSSNATPRAAKWDLAAMKKAMLKKNITFLKYNEKFRDEYSAMEMEFCEPRKPRKRKRYMISSQ